MAAPRGRDRVVEELVGVPAGGTEAGFDSRRPDTGQHQIWMYDSAP